VGAFYHGSLEAVKSVAYHAGAVAGNPVIGEEVLGIHPEWI